MSKGFYRQLAKTNMKKNGKIYTQRDCCCGNVLYYTIIGTESGI